MIKKFQYVVVMLIVIMLSLSLGACTNRLPKEETLSSVLENGNYEIVFEDNFDGDEVDMSTWIVGYPEISRAAAYYTEDAVSVRDGAMVITTDYREHGEYGEGWYTGWVESADSTSHIMSKANPHVRDYHKGFSQKYGYFEVRCKVPKSIGMWSAFWLMPCNKANGMTWTDDEIGTATDGVEIDVMESFYYSRLDKNKDTHVIHMDGYGEHLTSLKSPLIDVGGDIYDEFHTYGVLWTESEYIFYIDGKESWRTNGKYGDKDYGISAVNECILLTSEVPGADIDHPGQMLDASTGKYKKHWSGDARKNSKDKKYEFIIDYVRVYQN